MYRVLVILGLFSIILAQDDSQDQAGSGTSGSNFQPGQPIQESWGNSGDGQGSGDNNNQGQGESGQGSEGGSEYDKARRELDNTRQKMDQFYELVSRGLSGSRDGGSEGERGSHRSVSKQAKRLRKEVCNGLKAAEGQLGRAGRRGRERDEDSDDESD